MNVFRPNADFSSATQLDAQLPPLGFVQTTKRGAGDRVLCRVAHQLIARGLNVQGTVQVNTERQDDQLCDMDIEVLPSGRQLRISQSLGSGARGCRIDSAALETAVALVSENMGPETDLLVINKFGKREASGSGFRAVIGEAIALGVPVLTMVNGFNKGAFYEFSGGHHQELPADEIAILEWCLQLKNTGPKIRVAT